MPSPGMLNYNYRWNFWASQFEKIRFLVWLSKQIILYHQRWRSMHVHIKCNSSPTSHIDVFAMAALCIFLFYCNLTVTRYSVQLNLIIEILLQYYNLVRFHAKNGHSAYRIQWFLLATCVIRLVFNKLTNMIWSCPVRQFFCKSAQSGNSSVNHGCPNQNFIAPGNWQPNCRTLQRGMTKTSPTLYSICWVTVKPLANVDN